MPWDPYETGTPELAAERTRRRLMGQGIVVHKATPRDLVEIATNYADHPSMGKILRHSKYASPFRRAFQSPGAFLSAVGRGVQHLGGILIKEIPLPVLNTLLEKAWAKAAEALRDKTYHDKLKHYNLSSKDKVKFELKRLGQEVENWDRYRWKVDHAVKQYNLTVKEAEAMAASPCDRWVRVLAKRKYLGKRIDKLRVSVEAVKAVCEETLEWLSRVEKDYEDTHTKLKPLFEDDVRKLKNFAGAHETCSKEFCMYKDSEWTHKKSVPTSTAAQWFIKGAAVASDIVGREPGEYV